MFPWQSLEISLGVEGLIDLDLWLCDLTSCHCGFSQVFRLFLCRRFTSIEITPIPNFKSSAGIPIQVCARHKISIVSSTYDMSIRVSCPSHNSPWPLTSSHNFVHRKDSAQGPSFSAAIMEICGEIVWPLLQISKE